MLNLGSQTTLTRTKEIPRKGERKMKATTVDVSRWFDPTHEVEWDPKEVLFDTRTQMWQAFRYADVLRVMTNAQEFSQEYDRADDHPAYAAMWAADGKRHDDLRALVPDPFHAQMLSRWAPGMRDIADGLLDGVRARGTGEIELQGQFAIPFATRVIYALLGMNEADEPRIAAWRDTHAAAVTTGSIARQPDLDEYLTQLLREHRHHPQGGLLDEALQAQERGHLVEGKRLSDRDIKGYVWSVLFGRDTLSTSIGDLVIALMVFSKLDEVRADPLLIPTAIEESMRWIPAQPALPLRAKQDLVLGGQEIGAGEWVTVWLSAANRDPEVFLNPETFDIRRNPNPHLASGTGRHYCYGVPFVRLAMGMALQALLEKLTPPLQLDPTKEPRRRFGMVNRLLSAHVLFG
jgi:cytochrome P450